MFERFSYKSDNNIEKATNKKNRRNKKHTMKKSTGLSIHEIHFVVFFLLFILILVQTLWDKIRIEM